MEIELRDGWWWPKHDATCWQATRNTVGDLDLVMPLVRGRSQCIQAGGNCGIWPAVLCDRFDVVWTFEPDPENYLCLLRNVPRAKLRPFMAALGDVPEYYELRRVEGNCGAHQLTMKPGRTPIMTIDEFELTACDLIVLDIEGHEPLALKGAARTIERFKPVIMVEDNGQSQRYGVEGGWTESFDGYKVAFRIHNDTVLVPR